MIKLEVLATAPATENASLMPAFQQAKEVFSFVSDTGEWEESGP